LRAFFVRRAQQPGACALAKRRHLAHLRSV